jgi:fido (protein-threonine AMPylation protein)
MVTHQLKILNGRRYNYLVHNVRCGSKMTTISKYIGRGKLSKGRINELMEEYKPFFDDRIQRLKLYCRVAKYPHFIMTKEERDFIDELKDEYITYKEVFTDLERLNYEKDWITKYIFNTTNLEGNTLSLGETDLLLNKGVTPQGKSPREIREILNMQDCINYRKNYEGDITIYFIQRLHKLVLNKIDESAGKFKRLQNYITGTEFLPTAPTQVFDELKKLIEWYNMNKNAMHIFEVAVLFHQKFVMIHPFNDGNGRTTRELVNFILEKRGFPPIIYKSKDVKLYFDALEAGNNGNNKPLVELSYNTVKKDYSYIMNQDRLLDNWMLNEEEQKEVKTQGVTYMKEKQLKFHFPQDLKSNKKKT